MEINCKHKLLYNYGYMKKLGYRFHTVTTKEDSEYRNLRCISCGKEFKAKKNEFLFEKEDNVINHSDFNSFNELFNLYNEDLVNGEIEKIEKVKKKVYQK